MAKPTMNITAVARTAFGDTRVPRATRTAPTRVAVRYATARLGRKPPKSDMTSRAKQPKTMKMTFCGSRKTSAPKAKAAGMTMAAREARRRAANPGSRGALSGKRRLAVALVESVDLPRGPSLGDWGVPVGDPGGFLLDS